ncbi:MAG: rane protein of unknown function [Frankiales bacterium]|nr:rane protein of unknown function [Frankiales bacterium]
MAEAEDSPRDGWHWTVKTTFVALLLGSAFIAIWLNRSHVLDGVGGLQDLRWGWVVAAFASECLSMLAFAAVQHRLLHVGGHRLTLAWLTANAYTANAISLAVPYVGSTMAAGYTLRQMRARRVDPVVAGTVLTLGGVFSTVAFGLVLLAGAIASNNVAVALMGILAAALTLAATVVAVIALRRPGGRDRIAGVCAGALKLGRRVTNRPRSEPSELVDRALQRVLRFRFSAVSVGSVLGWALLNWVANVACLAFALEAAGADVPWRSLPIIWGIGVGAASFAPTPGGIGIVETVLSAALVSAGTSTANAVTAVLVYRVLSFNMLVALLTIVARAVNRQRQRLVRRRDEVERHRALARSRIEP